MTNENNKNFSRRKFLQGGAVLGTAIGLSTITNKKQTEQVAKAIGVKELDEFPHKVNADFKRYDQKRMRGRSPETTVPPEKSMFDKVIDDSKPGYTSLEKALQIGAGSVDMNLGTLTGYTLNTPLYPWDAKPSEKKYEFGSKEDASKAIKRAAKFYGASLVGITPYDERWVYNPMVDVIRGTEVYDTEFPFKPKSVIVIAVEMDYEGMSAAPSTLEMATTMKGYSNIAEVNYKVSSFVRALGFNAFGAGGDVAESVPYAIAAGLGEQGRQGLLITYEYGPRVRLSKVFTEMELAYDKPIEFGANKFCQVCKKCAENCPSKSISLADEMTYKAENYSVSNHEGVYKYYVNVTTCDEYWSTVGSDCGVCIASCPYNKPDFWHHRITTALTATPLKPFLNEMDDIFGYGNVFDENVPVKFWDLETYAGKKY